MYFQWLFVDTGIDYSIGGGDRFVFLTDFSVEFARICKVYEFDRKAILAWVGLVNF